MSLQSATTAKTSSDGITLDSRGILTSLVMTVINNEITAQSEKTGMDERNYKAVLTLDADINNGTKPIQIIQSDASRVVFSDIIKALTDAGYRASHTAIPETRKGIADRVKLQIAWGP